MNQTIQSTILNFWLTHLLLFKVHLVNHTVYFFPTNLKSFCRSRFFSHRGRSCSNVERGEAGAAEAFEVGWKKVNFIVEIASFCGQEKFRDYSRRRGCLQVYKFSVNVNNNDRLIPSCRKGSAISPLFTINNTPAGAKQQITDAKFIAYGQTTNKLVTVVYQKNNCYVNSHTREGFNFGSMACSIADTATNPFSQ